MSICITGDREVCDIVSHYREVVENWKSKIALHINFVSGLKSEVDCAVGASVHFTVYVIDYNIFPVDLTGWCKSLKSDQRYILLLSGFKVVESGSNIEILVNKENTLYVNILSKISLQLYKTDLFIRDRLSILPCDNPTSQITRRMLVSTVKQEITFKRRHLEIPDLYFHSNILTTGDDDVESSSDSDYVCLETIMSLDSSVPIPSDRSIVSSFGEGELCLPSMCDV